MYKTVAIITSRYHSKRLPGKALLDLCGKPVLRHVIDTLRACDFIDDVVVATSTQSQPIIDYCTRENISFFAGSEDDMLGRIHDAARAFSVQIIVRVWGDCVMLNLSNLIEMFKKSNLDYLYTKGGSRGQQVSIMTYPVLSQAFYDMTPEERYIFNEVNEHEWFVDRCNNMCVDRDPSDEIDCVDTLEDLEYLRRKLEKSKTTMCGIS